MTSMAFLNLLMDLVDTEGSFKRLEEISLSIPIWRFQAHIKDMTEYLNIWDSNRVCNHRKFKPSILPY